MSSREEGGDRWDGRRREWKKKGGKQRQRQMEVRSRERGGKEMEGEWDWKGSKQQLHESFLKRIFHFVPLHLSVFEL